MINECTQLAPFSSEGRLVLPCQEDHFYLTLMILKTLTLALEALELEEEPL